MKKIANFATAIWKDESGISSVEYAMLLAFVSAGIIFSVDLLGKATSAEMSDVAACIGGGTPPVKEC